MPEYQSLTDDEVLRIATERDQLTDDARIMLDSELSRRRLSSEEIRSYADAYSESERKEAQARSKRNGSGSFVNFGLTFLGKRNLRLDPSGLFEEYDSTQWFVIFWIPVFPVASFTVRRSLERWMGLTWRSDPEIVARHARDWNQILLTWVKTAGVLLLLRLAFVGFISYQNSIHPSPNHPPIIIYRPPR